MRLGVFDCNWRNSNCEIGVARLEIGDWRLRDWRLRDWSSLFPELLTGLWKLLCEVYIWQGIHSAVAWKLSLWETQRRHGSYTWASRRASPTRHLKGTVHLVKPVLTLHMRAALPQVARMLVCLPPVGGLNTCFHCTCGLPCRRWFVCSYAYHLLVNLTSAPITHAGCLAAGGLYAYHLLVDLTPAPITHAGCLAAGGLYARKILLCAKLRDDWRETRD